MVPRLIGISGRIGSGKDTFGEMLSESIPETVVIRKYADILKAAAALLLNVKRRNLEDHDFKELLLPEELQQVVTNRILDENTKPTSYTHKTEHTYRWFLQAFGTEVVRHIHPDFWVWSFFANLYDPNVITIITDVRYENEAKAIRDRGGMLIRMERKSSRKPLYLFSSPHTSETSLDDFTFDHVIHNDGSLDMLAAKADELIQEWSQH